MIVPWSGFPMTKLVELARPLGSAKFVEMHTFENPEVAHPRWSQATEELIGTNGERRPTLLFNGYGEYVADLYKGLERERLWV